MIQIYIDYFIEKDEKSLISKHPLLHSFCYFFGFFLNFIPFKISQINSRVKGKPITNKLKKENSQSIEYIYNNPNENYLSKKDLLKIFFASLIILLTEIVGVNPDNNNNEDEEPKYDDELIIFEYLTIFFVSHCEEVYYKHHYISFLILILVQVIKAGYFLIKDKYQALDIIIIIFSIIYSILYAIFFYI